MDKYLSVGLRKDGKGVFKGEHVCTLALITVPSLNQFGSLLAN